MNTRKTSVAAFRCNVFLTHSTDGGIPGFIIFIALSLTFFKLVMLGRR